MASSSSLALRRLFSSTVVPRSFRPAASLRLLSTDAVVSHEDVDDSRIRRRNRSFSPRAGYINSDMFHPTSGWSKGEINFMDQFGQRPRWDAKEKEDALHLRIDMPGLSREDVKLALEQNSLVIKGEVDEEGDEHKISSMIGLPENVYKTDEIKAEMKNGVLKVVVPKLKVDERKNVRLIQVD